MTITTTRDTRLIVFDWDGTLMDSTGRIVASMRAAAQRFGVAVPSELEVKEIIGLGLSEALGQLFPGVSAEAGGRLVELYRHEYLEASPVPAPLFVGARTMLENLCEAGYVLGIATGKNRRGLDRVLADTGLLDYFASTRCADETQSKPHPQMLMEIMSETGFESHQTLMVGDTEYDMKMANECGAGPIAVSHGAHALERLLRHAPLAHFDSLAHLPAWLAEHRGNDA